MPGVYGLTQSALTKAWSIVDLESGNRFSFPQDEGPLLADLLDGQWPRCESCEGRERCDMCEQCYDCFCECEDESSNDEDSGDDENPGGSS